MIGKHVLDRRKVRRRRRLTARRAGAGEPEAVTAGLADVGVVQQRSTVVEFQAPGAIIGVFGYSFRSRGEGAVH